MTDEEEFAEKVKPVRAAASVLLTEFFGERCPDFDPNCECCKRWRMLDDLTDNPFAH